MPFDLMGTKALVTGATGGIGQALCERLAQQGASLAVTGTRQAVLDEVAAKYGANTLAVPADLSQSGGAESLIAELAKADFVPDVLVLNAGVTRDALLMRMTDEAWDTVYQTNLRATFALTRACLRSMMKARFGRIIAITSVVGAGGNAGQSNYAASKAGTTGFIKSVALETANRNITANCIAPGFIGTAMTDAIPDSAREAIIGRIPAGHIGTPDDVAYAVAFLASKEAKYITGQTLHVNGGMAMPS